MRSQGLLSSPTTAASPWVRHFDNTTQTPWLYNPSNNQYISYDDPVSLGVKTQYALSNDLAGLFVWSVDEDNDELLAAIAPMVASNPAKTPIANSTSTTASASTTTSTASSTTTVKTTTTAVGSSTTTVVSTTTTSSVSATATATSGAGCAGVATWSATTAYVGGTEVVYNGNLYKCQWWTQDEIPGSSNTSWATWQLVQAC